MMAYSAPVRISRRIRVVRAGRANAGAPRLPTDLADELHTTRFRRRIRGLISASRSVCSNRTLSRFAAADSLAVWNTELWDEAAARCRACA
jgi:hypothetical protein